MALNLSRVALAKDEVFLILAFIYCEAKRQEKTVFALIPSDSPRCQLTAGY